MTLVRQHIGEVEGPDGSRLILRPQLIDEERGPSSQREMWEVARYRYVVTDLPREWSALDIVDATYQRGNQENTIAGLGTSIAAWRTPVAEMRGNAPLCLRGAHSLRVRPTPERPRLVVKTILPRPS